MTKKNLLAIVLFGCCLTQVQAQEKEKKYPQPEAMRPGMSEYWTPQPKVVKPGDIKTNSAPSDAIVLFDGKDLSAWTNGNGGPAEWKVKDGIVTVDKSNPEKDRYNSSRRILLLR